MWAVRRGLGLGLTCRAPGRRGAGGLCGTWEAWARGLANLLFPELPCGCCHGRRTCLSTFELSFPHLIRCG